MLKKTTLVILIFWILLIPLTATENHLAVPLGHRVYPILKSAEIRGIIDTGLNVRPYTTSTVLTYLETITHSNVATTEEKNIAIELVEELSDQEQNNSFSSILRSGSYRTYSELLDVDAAMGAHFSSLHSQSLTDLTTFDSRNIIDVYLRAHIKGIISFNMDFGLTFDHLEPQLFLKNDFKVPARGQYDTLINRDSDDHIYYYGLYERPEIALSTLKGNMLIRWASIEHDWGVGKNNFMISSTAKPFNAIEISTNIAPWLRYAFIAGTLGNMYVGKEFRESNDYSKTFFNEYHLSGGNQDPTYDTAYTAHRAEVDFSPNFTAGVYEAVLYGNRFELGYLNPASLLFHEQNIMGDYDNGFAGLDFQWYLPGILRAYGAVATTEMNTLDPKKFFKVPRNILAYQGGVDVHIPWLSFSTATIQYTYLPPFFYAHRPQQIVKVENGTPVVSYRELFMVNEGANIGYPLRPNSDEILLSFDFNFPKGWDGTLSMKYQRRSGQYGWNLNKFMAYAASNAGEFEDKDFKGYLFERTLGIEATAHKTLKNAPIRFTFAYMFSMNQNRGTPEPAAYWGDKENKVLYPGDPELPSDADKNYHEYPVIKYKIEGPWSSWAFTHVFRFGVDIWY